MSHRKRRLFVECDMHHWDRASKFHDGTFRGWLENMTYSVPGVNSLLGLVRKHKTMGEPGGRLDFGRESY